MEITEISIQKRNKKRSNIYIDGVFCCSLDNFTVVKNHLVKGMEITDSFLGEIQLESEKDKALNYAFDYISKYVKTEKQLRDKLYEKGYLTGTVNYVMDKIKAYKYVDDEAYSKSYLNYSKNKKGLKLIKYELKMKGVKEEILDTLTIDEEDEVQACKAQADKFFSKNEVTRENLQKLYAKLLRGGFSFDAINCAISKVSEDDE